MTTRLTWLGTFALAVLNALSAQAQQPLPQPSLVPTPSVPHAGIEAVGDLVRAADHLEAAGADELAAQVRQQARMLVKQESERLAEQQMRLLELSAGLPTPQFHIPTLICEVPELTAEDLHCAITSAAGEARVSREQDACVWTVGRNCSIDLYRRLTGDDESRVKILSRPQVLTLDRQAATIQIGQQVPVVQGVTFVDDRATPNLEPEQFGIEFSVTPQLLNGQNARFEVCLERSWLTTEVPIYSDPASGASDLGPVKDSTAIRATAELQSGGTLILALPPQIGDAAADEDSPPLLLFIATPRLIEGD